jgi:hypothetical protein
VAYLKNGVNIRNITEIATTSDPRIASNFSTSKFLFNGKTHEAQYGTKMIAHYDGYMYSSEAGIKNSFRRNGVASFAVSARGYRPFPTYTRRRWQSSTAGTYYVNKFSNGEVWVSTTYNSRTGTRISTTSEDIQFLFVLLVGPGGGGGGGNGTKAGGGGGGGSFAYLCHRLVAGWVHRIYIGAGGSGGARNTNGGGGDNCQFSTFTDINNLGYSGVTTVNASGGGAGRSGANDGVGGSGGTVSSYDANNSYIRRLDERTGTSGGARGGNAGGSTSAYQTQSYTPEGNRLDYGQGEGGTNPNGSGGCGGGGWFYGHNGGAGGNNGGNGSSGGIGAGGGAGAWAVFAGGSGASGGNGYAALFY